MDNAVAIVNDLSPDLTDQEMMFLYQVEVIGLPVIRAAEISGVNSPYLLLKKPHIVQAREKYREAVRGRTDFSREDVVAGYKEAIDFAKITGEPMAMIAGWREIAKIKGFDKMPSVQLHLHGTVEQMKRQIAALPTEELMRLSGEQVIDGDFYRVEDGAADIR